MQCGMRVIVLRLFVLAKGKYSNSRHVHASMSVGVGELMITSESMRQVCLRKEWLPWHHFSNLRPSKRAHDPHAIRTHAIRTHAKRTHAIRTHRPQIHADRQTQQDRHPHAQTLRLRHSDTVTQTRTHYYTLSS